MGVVSALGGKHGSHVDVYACVDRGALLQWRCPPLPARFLAAEAVALVIFKVPLGSGFSRVVGPRPFFMIPRNLLQASRSRTVRGLTGAGM